MRRTVQRDERGVVAVWLAVMLPGLIMAISMGIEISNWAGGQIAVQRVADLSAMAGAMYYKTGGNARASASYAARFAQLNGANGSASPSWDAASNTLTSGQITVQVVPGLQSNANTALRVTVARTIPKTISQFFSSGSVTVAGTSIAELVGVGTAGSGGQPCVVALSGTGTVSGQGSTYLTMPNCAIRSNNTVDVHGGGGPLSTAGIYAANAVNIDAWIATAGGQYPNSGGIPDPYAGNAALQGAFASTAAITATTANSIACGSVQGVPGTAGQYTGSNNCNGSNTLPNGGTCATSGGVTCTLHPGNYGSFSATGGPYTFNFQPGLYQFKGNIALTNATTSNGTGVTIVTTGSFVGSNSFNFNITAPTPAQASSTGGIAAIALTSNSATAATISGNAAFNITGVAYFPNATFDASGSSCNSSAPCFGSNSTTCLEIIAQSVKLTGNANFNSGCASLGAATFTSIPGSSATSAGLVR